MIRERIEIGGIPAIVWGKESDRVWLCVHGKMSSKEAFEELAGIAESRGCQTLSFDLPQHGERINGAERCDIWNGKRELEAVGEYVFGHWTEASLYACSLGAFFSLHAYKDYGFRKCLFQSPIVDMEYLIRQMMIWFGITEERLEREREIGTPIDLMTWDYFRYVIENPIEKWNIPTNILFGGRDNLQTRACISGFAERFGCGVTVSEDSEHPFMGENDPGIVRRWLMENM